jgi:ankyrin repeat protein
LINKICGVYDLDDAGQSALHGACKKDNPEMVELLLQHSLLKAMLSAFKPFIFNTFTSQFHLISSSRAYALLGSSLQALNIGVSPNLSR